MSHLFRGIGPLVFLSYSFSDKDVAADVASRLNHHGCRVRMEDESSLIGKALTEALPARIADAEALVQIRTEAAERSAWIQRELEYATRPRKRGPAAIVVVLSLDRVSTLNSSEHQLVVGSRESLGQAVDDVFHHVLESVRPLPLSDSDPFKFEAQSVARALKGANGGKRIIVDSEGKLMRWTDETLAYIEGSSFEHRQPWLKQEQRRKARLEAMLGEFDRDAEKLIDNLARGYASWGCSFPGSADSALDYFCTIRLGLLVAERAAQAPAGHVELRVKYVDVLNALLARLPSRDDSYRAYIAWTHPDRPRFEASSEEDRIATRVLESTRIGDKQFEYFVQEATRDLGAWARNNESLATPATPPCRSENQERAPAASTDPARAKPSFRIVDVPLRGVGPTVLISFQADDQSVASALKRSLEELGCRSTLDTPKLTPAEPDTLLEGFEIFIQLRSYRQEARQDQLFLAAVARHDHQPDFQLILIALDGAQSGKAFGDWVFINAIDRPLSSAVVEVVKQVAQSAVHALPLSIASPFELDQSAIERALLAAPHDKRRLLSDADGFFSNVTQLVPTNQIEKPLRSMDVSLRLLIEALYQQHQGGYSFHQVDYLAQGTSTVQRFCRLVLWHIVGKLGPYCAYMDPRRRQRIRPILSEVSQHVTPGVAGSLEKWALQPLPRHPVMDLVAVEAWGPPNKRVLTWQLPASVSSYFRGPFRAIPTAPKLEIGNGDWMDIVLPQIAYSVWREGLNPAEQPNIDVAWDIKDYVGMTA